MTSQPINDPVDAIAEPAERRELVIRRAPKFVPFLIAGGVVGVIVAGIMALAAPGGVEYDRSSVFGFLTVLLAIPGVGLGAVVALVLDRRSLRRTDRTMVESMPESDADAAADTDAEPTGA
jgi:hypothetical protein